MTDPQPDTWASLRHFTAARIALGRAGHSIPTGELLRFQLAHAQARDAVYAELAVQDLRQELHQISCSSVVLQSRARNRTEYVKRPDWGRQLNEESQKMLQELKQSAESFDVAFVLADGLSAHAVQSHAVPLLAALLPLLQKTEWKVAPVAVTLAGRVAIGDIIGHLLGAQIVVVLIGERPGLSSPDSLGAYLTYHPEPGLTDDARNCISNIRPAGLPYQAAALKMFYLLTEMRNRKLSGVQLKDEMMPPQLH